MKYLHSGLVLIAGFLGAAAATSYADHDATTVHRKSDVREAILRRFFRENHCPAESYAEAFIVEADSHKLDWRLLPSLALVESGGGQRQLKNNFFGWDNGVSRFVSATEAIHHVAQALAEARPYKGKDTNGKLAAYNKTPGYRELVTGVMRRISPVATPEAL
jgi:hypothetical protein